MKLRYIILVCLFLIISLFANPIEIERLDIANESASQEFVELRSESFGALDISEYSVELSCELSTEPNNISLNLVNSYDAAVDTLVVSFEEVGCLNLLSPADTVIYDIPSGETVSLGWNIETICDSMPSCFNISMISTIVEPVEDTLTGEIDTMVTVDSTRVFGCATDSDCSTFDIIVNPVAPLDGEFSSYELQTIFFQVYDEVGDDIIDSSIVGVLNGADTFHIGSGYNFVFSEGESLLAFSPIGYTTWEDGDTVNFQVISAENSRGSGLAEPVGTEFYIDRSSPVVCNIVPEPDGHYSNPYPSIEFDIVDSLSGLNWDSFLLRVGSDVYRASSPHIEIDGNHITFISPVPFLEGEEIRISISAQDNPDYSTANELSFRYYISGEGYPPWTYPIEPEDGDISSCEGQDIEFEIRDRDGIIDTSIHFNITINETETLELDAFSTDVTYSYSDGVASIVYSPEEEFENGDNIQVEVTSVVDSTGSPLPEIQSWSFQIDRIAPLIWDIWPEDGENIRTSRPAISWKMWDPGFGMDHIEFDMSIFGMSFEMTNSAFHYYPEESLVVFSTEEAGIDFIGGDTVAMELTYRDNVTLCEDHSGSMSWYFVIEGGGPLAGVARPSSGTISSCIDEYFAFTLVDSTGIDTNTITIEINGDEIDWADGGFEYDFEEEMLYYVPDSLADGHYNISLVHADDIIGNHLLFPVSTSFVYDTKSPVILDASIPDGNIIDEPSPTFSFNYKDSTSGLERDDSYLRVNDTEYPLTTSDAIILTDTMITFDCGIAGIELMGGESLSVTAHLVDRANDFEDTTDWSGTSCLANFIDTTWTFFLSSSSPIVEILRPMNETYVSCDPLEIHFEVNDTVFDVDDSSVVIRVHRPEHEPALDDTFTLESPELVEDGHTEDRFILTHSTEYQSGENVYVEILSVSNNIGTPSSMLPIEWSFTVDYAPPVADTIYPPYFYVSNDTMKICFAAIDSISDIYLEDSKLAIDADTFNLANPSIAFDGDRFCFHPALAGISWEDSTEYSISLQLFDVIGHCDANYAEYSWILHSNFSAIEESSVMPLDFALGQNRPNPFNPATTIDFVIAEKGEIDLSVYDINGNKIAVVAKGIYEPGKYSAIFDGNEFNSGLYFYKLNHANGHKMQKMMLIK